MNLQTSFAEDLIKSKIYEEEANTKKIIMNKKEKNTMFVILKIFLSIKNIIITCFCFFLQIYLSFLTILHIFYIGIYINFRINEKKIFKNHENENIFFILGGIFILTYILCLTLINLMDIEIIKNVKSKYFKLILTKNLKYFEDDYKPLYLKNFSINCFKKNDESSNLLNISAINNTEISNSIEHNTINNINFESENSNKDLFDYKNKFANINILEKYSRYFYYSFCCIFAIICSFIIHFKIGLCITITTLILLILNYLQKWINIRIKKNPNFNLNAVKEYLYNIRESQSLQLSNFLLNKFIISSCPNIKSNKNYDSIIKDYPFLKKITNENDKIDKKDLFFNSFIIFLKVIIFLNTLLIISYSNDSIERGEKIFLLEIYFDNCFLLTLILFNIISLLSINMIFNQVIEIDNNKDEFMKIISLIMNTQLSVNQIGLMTKPNIELIIPSIRFNKIKFEDDFYLTSNNNPYIKNSNVLIFNDCTFTIKPYEKISLIGKNLSYAIPNILYNNLNEYSGEIYIDSFKLPDIDNTHLKKLIGIVESDILIYENMSILDNIVFGREELIQSLIDENKNKKYNLEDSNSSSLKFQTPLKKNIKYDFTTIEEIVIKTCKLTKIWDFIENLNDKLNYIISSEDLKKISSFHLKLICLTRSILLDPKIIIIKDPNKFIYDLNSISYDYNEEISYFSSIKTSNNLGSNKIYKCQVNELSNEDIKELIRSYDSILKNITNDKTVVLLTDDDNYINKSSNDDKIKTDRIILFENGNILYDGNYNALLNVNDVKSRYIKNKVISHSEKFEYLNNFSIKKNKELDIIKSKSYIKNIQSNLNLQKSFPLKIIFSLSNYLFFNFQEENYLLNSDLYNNSLSTINDLTEFYNISSNTLFDILIISSSTWFYLYCILYCLLNISLLFFVLFLSYVIKNDLKFLIDKEIVIIILIIAFLLILIIVINYIKNKIKVSFSFELQKQLFKVYLDQEDINFFKDSKRLNNSKYFQLTSQNYKIKDYKRINYLLAILSENSTEIDKYIEYNIIIIGYLILLISTIFTIFILFPIFGGFIVISYLILLIINYVIIICQRKYYIHINLKNKKSETLFEKTITNIATIQLYNFKQKIVILFKKLIDENNKIIIFLLLLNNTYEGIYYLIYFIWIPIYSKIVSIETFNNSIIIITLFLNLTFYIIKISKLSLMMINFKNLKSNIVEYFLLYFSKEINLKKISINEDNIMKESLQAIQKLEVKNFNFLNIENVNLQEQNMCFEFFSKKKYAFCGEYYISEFIKYFELIYHSNSVNNKIYINNSEINLLKQKFNLEKILTIFNNSSLFFEDIGIYENLSTIINDNQKNKIKNIFDFCEIELDELLIDCSLDKVSCDDMKKIAIGRNILNDSKIILINDIEQEFNSIQLKYIIKYLNSNLFNSNEKIVIILSNNNELLKLCDKIYYIENFKIKEEGSYNELLLNKQDFSYRHK